MIFNVSVVDFINIMIIALGLGVCGLCLLQIAASIHLRKDVRRYFRIFFSMISLYISAHLARQMMDGVAGNGVRVALMILTTTEMITAGLMTHMMSLLILSVAKAEKATARFGLILFALLIVHVAIIAVGVPRDLIFSFDAGNEYHRSGGYLLSNLSPVLMMAVDVWLLIRYRRNIDVHVKSALWLYIVAPVIAIIVQGIFYGIQFIIFATVGAAVYMFAVIMQLLNEEYEKQRRENYRIESELNLATRIQADMIPNIYPAFPDRSEFDIFATMDPAKEVGGDFYDFFLVDPDHLCVVMADVSGKGVPAALFMMASKIILANNAMIGKSPGKILEDTNAAICSHNREEMFVTVWIGILDIPTGRLVAANAGHEYPVVKHADGSFEVYRDKHGFVVGGMAGLKYQEYEMQFEPGSKLFLYTDGVPEATDAEGEMYGADRMIAALNRVKDGTTVDVLKGVRASVDGFVKDAEQFDDLTMLCMEYRGRENEDAPGENA